MNTKAVINNKKLTGLILQDAKLPPPSQQVPKVLRTSCEVFGNCGLKCSSRTLYHVSRTQLPRAPPGRGSPERARCWEQKCPVSVGLFINLALNIYSQALTWLSVKDHSEKKKTKNPVPSSRKCTKHRFLFLAAVVSIARVTAALLWFLKNLLDKKGQQN